ncbi:hypothetical protein TRFO_13154 [Tritrichomonas foetus]|uniref:Uncharacterized protein n=1 Tax=Tritrichomonas foetus TaxID=1144522 RepID=A0A1J4L3R4_9EUKA|nr:hypothetical protein TRFO_13154 [Tritrichomonas foetus]|eukprot:OHT16557.1 hypothetical protein TRFO_13154 [Tritrichomonas foetus]
MKDPNRIPITTIINTKMFRTLSFLAFVLTSIIYQKNPSTAIVVAFNAILFIFVVTYNNELEKSKQKRKEYESKYSNNNNFNNNSFNNFNNERHKDEVSKSKHIISVKKASSNQEKAKIKPLFSNHQKSKTNTIELNEKEDKNSNSNPIEKLLDNNKVPGNNEKFIFSSRFTDIDAFQKKPKIIRANYEKQLYKLSEIVFDDENEEEDDLNIPHQVDFTRKAELQAAIYRVVNDERIPEYADDIKSIMFKDPTQIVGGIRCFIEILLEILKNANPIKGSIFGLIMSFIFPRNDPYRKVFESQAFSIFNMIDVNKMPTDEFRSNVDNLTKVASQYSSCSAPYFAYWCYIGDVHMIHTWIKTHTTTKDEYPHFAIGGVIDVINKFCFKKLHDTNMEMYDDIITRIHNYYQIVYKKKDDGKKRTPEEEEEFMNRMTPEEKTLYQQTKFYQSFKRQFNTFEKEKDEPGVLDIKYNKYFTLAKYNEKL